MSIKELLEEHNELAEKTGKMKLNSWKQSRDKLVGRIEELRKLSGDKKPKKSLNQPKSPTVKKANELIEKEAARKTKADNEITIAEVAEGIGMSPKIARAKLRRKGHHSNEGRWPTVTRDSKEHKDLVALLKGGSQ